MIYERIFTDEVAQGIKLPYAFVTADTSPRVKKAGDRYEETTTISVIIEIEESDDMFDKLDNIGSQLEDVLEYITLKDGDKLRGDNFHSVIQNGYIDFTVDYKYFIRKIKDAEETMQNVTTSLVTKY